MRNHTGNTSNSSLCSIQPRSAPWTAARCNRTLRQLTAFLAKIEKWHKDFNHRQVSSTQSLHNLNPHIGSSSFRGSRRASRKRSTYEHDPDWLLHCEPPLQKRQKNYGGKRHAQKSAKPPRTPKALRRPPGDILIDTPLITGSRASPEQHAEESKKDRLSRNSIYNQRKLGDINNQEDYNTIVQALPNIVQVFLDTTKDEETKNEDGARSLLAMCQRRIPDCIIEEQSLYDRQKEDEGNIQVASQLCSELEDVFSTGTGWKPLRAIVRSHGIRQICNAIDIEHLTPVTAASLAYYCAALGHFDAYELFSESLLFVAMHDNRSSSEQVALPNRERLFKDWLQNSSLHSPVKAEKVMIHNLQVVERALSNKEHPLPLHLLSLDTSLVRSSISLLTSGGPSSHLGATFLHAFILRSLDVSSGLLNSTGNSPLSIGELRGLKRIPPGKEQQNTLWTTEGVQSMPQSTVKSRSVYTTAKSILTILTSTALSRHNGKDADDRILHLTFNLVTRLMMNVELQKELSCARDSLPQIDAVAIYIWLTNFLLPGLEERDFQNTGSSTLSSFEELLGYTSSKSEILDRGTGFLLDIVSCCGRVERNDGYLVLKHSTDKLRSFRESSYPRLCLTLQDIAVGAAISFAQRYKRIEYYEWASEIQREFSASIQQGSLQLEVPHLAKDWKPYIWDESIEEWIAETPVSKHDAPAPRRQTARVVVDTLAPRTGVFPFLHHNVEQSQLQLEPPTPDLLALPSPPRTSSPSPSPSTPSCAAVKMKSKRKSDGLRVESNLTRRPVSKVPKRNHSYGPGNATDSRPIVDEKEREEGLRQRRRSHAGRKLKIHVHVDEDGDDDELAPTPRPVAKRRRTRSRDRLALALSSVHVDRRNHREQHRARARGKFNINVGTESGSGSEDELGVL